MKRDIYSEFRKTVEENNLIKPKEKIILGISGGPDSVFLFHMLAELRKEWKINIIAAHFNHKLREESDREKEFVEGVCKENNIEVVSEDKDVKKLYNGDSLEQTARRLRYDFFEKLSRKYKCKKIVLGHHKDDLVETVFLRLVRGAGLLGLRGMMPLTKYKKIVLIRPLLNFEKKYLVGYLKRNNISFVVDKSNFQENFLRNKIRHKVIPLLKEIAPSINDNIYNMTRSIARDYDFIYKEVEKKLEKISNRGKKNELKLKLGRLLQVEESLFYHIIRLAVESVKGNLRKIESKHIDEIVHLIRNRPTGSIVDIPSLQVIKKADIILIRKLI